MTLEKLEPRWCPECGTKCELDYLGEQAGEHQFRVVTARDAGMATEMRWPTLIEGARTEVYFVGIGRNAERKERYWVPLRMCWHCERAIAEPLTTRTAPEPEQTTIGGIA